MTAVEKAAYDDLPDGVVVADADGRVVAFNPAAARLLGTTADSALGRPLGDVLPLTDDQGRDWWACTDPYGGLSSRTRQPERQLVLAGGSDLLVTAAYVRGPDRKVARVVVALRDTHARERIERSRANLVSTVAHELRSPLTSVKGFTATLLAKWERFNDDQKKLMLQTVNADADRVTRLITELLDVSRIDAGRLEMRKQVVDLPAAIRRTVAGRVASGESEDRFIVRELGELPEMWVDPDKFQQVIGNLVENAVKHGDGTVTVTMAPLEDGAVITVSDEGEGIPEATATRVFTRFWRGGDRRGGTGLGLYIVKGLIEAHGGSVAVGRASSGGAEFRFVLPAGTPDFI
ncbi:MAG: sensor histidine kinase [Frankiales bacterium]|nr:sensor histidine kinase [Frankiales bacterium]